MGKNASSSYQAGVVEQQGSQGGSASSNPNINTDLDIQGGASSQGGGSSYQGGGSPQGSGSSEQGGSSAAVAEPEASNFVASTGSNAASISPRAAQSMSSNQDDKSGKGLNIKQQQQQEAKNQEAAANQASKVPELSAEMVKSDQGSSSSSGSLLDEIMAMGDEDANELKPKPLSPKERAARRRAMRGNVRDSALNIKDLFRPEKKSSFEIFQEKEMARRAKEAKHKALKAGKTVYGPKSVKLKPAKPVKAKKAAKKQSRPVEQRPVKQGEMNGFSLSDAVANDDGSVGQFDKVALDSAARIPQAVADPEGYNQVERQRMQPVDQEELERELFEQYNPVEEMEINLPSTEENEDVADLYDVTLDDEVTQPLPREGGTLDSLNDEFDLESHYTELENTQITGYTEAMQKDIDEVTARQAKQRVRYSKARHTMWKRFQNPIENFRIEGDTQVGAEGKDQWVRSDEVKVTLSRIMEIYHCTENEAVQLVQLSAGLGVDNNGNIMGTKAEDFTLSQDYLNIITSQIIESQNIYGHPFGSPQEMWLGGTKCYPISCIPDYLVGSLKMHEDSPWHGRSIDEIQAELNDYWMETTLPELWDDTTAEGEIGQRNAVLNQAQCMQEIKDGPGMTSRLRDEWGINPNDQLLTIPEITNRRILNSDSKAFDPEFKGAVAEQTKQLQDSRKQLRKVADRNSRLTPAQNAAQFATSTMRTFAIMRPELWLGNVTEKIKGAAFSRVAQGMLGQHYAQYMTEEEAQMFCRTAHIEDATSSQEAINVIKAVTNILRVGGPDALTVWFAERHGATDLVSEQDQIAFLEKYIQGKKQEAGDDPKAKAALHDMQLAMSKLIDNVMTGGGITYGWDMQHFVTQYLLNNMMTYAAAKKSKEARPYVTAADIEESMRAVGVEATLMQMMNTDEGRNALLSINQLNMGRRDPASACVELFFSKHPCFEFLYAAGVDKFLSFGIKQIELWLPMTSTFNYMVAHNMVKRAEGDLSKLGEYQRAWVVNTMGIHQSNQRMGETLFSELGFKQCLAYDCAQLGSGVLIAGFFAVLSMMFMGDDDEPDEARKNSAEEWIWCPLGRLVPSWWMYDMLGWGYGMGASIAAFAKTGNPQLSFNIMVNNTAEVLSGSAVADTINTVYQLAYGTDIVAKMASDPDYEAPADFGQRSLSSYGEQMLAKLCQNFTPGFVNGYLKESLLWGTDARDHSAYTYYDKDGNVRSIDNYEEQLRRTWCKNNLLYATLCNFFKKGDSQYSEYTGYLPWEMPVATKTDPVSLAYYDKYNLPDNADAATKQLYAESLLSDLEQFSSPEDAINQGLVIPYSARENLKEYLEGKKIEVEMAYLTNYGNAAYVTSRLAYYDMKAQKDTYTNLLSNWVYNSDIPSKSNGYEKLLSDYQVNYRFKDSGETASALDYVCNPSNVEKVYLQMGNAPSSILPFTTVERTGNYNDETGVGWYNDTTDVNRVLSALGGRTLTYGADAGAKVGNTIMGSQDPAGKDDSAEWRISTEGESPTINNRRYVYRNDSAKLEEASEDDLKAAAARYGIDYSEYEKLKDQVYSGGSSSSSKTTNYKYSSGSGSSKSYSKSYGGSSYSKSYSKSSSGSSSSSYNPKIYSYSSRVYNTKAQGMDVKTPYKASTTYLRPGFSTKGSREAYKRSDM